jgi:GT2 family glycosyltransferase
MSDLHIIIVSYNCWPWLKQTLSTLKEFYLDTTKAKVTVEVVDNHSSDETPQLLGKTFPWVEAEFLPENLGFAKGNNHALRKVDAKYVMLCNADVQFHANSNLDILLQYLDDHPRVGVVTPRLELSNGQIDMACHRGEPTPWRALTYFAGLEKLLPSQPLFSGYHLLHQDLETTHTIEACSGAAMIIRTSILEKVGLLDERFFMYAEDLDWCRRIREHGWEIVYLPEVQITHHKNKSGIDHADTQLSQTTSSHFYDTMIQYFEKHYRAWYHQPLRWLIGLAIAIKKQSVLPKENHE